MAPVPSPDEFISGYVYRAWDGTLIPLGLDEVIQLKMPNPMDPYRGMGPVQSILSVADSRRYSIEWNRNFFINSAEPGGFVVFNKTLNDTEFKKWQDRWREQHKGVARAHTVGILENSTWVERKMSQRDMQFAQMVDVSGELMMEAFGIHKASLGRSDDVNLANALAARWLMADDIIVPRLDRFKGALNEKLLPFYDPDPALGFDYDDPRPTDEDSENNARDSKVSAAMAIVEKGGDWDATLEAFELPAIPRTATPAPPVVAP
jgi:phage portal protein BeeE